MTSTPTVCALERFAPTLRSHPRHTPNAAFSPHLGTLVHFPKRRPVLVSRDGDRRSRLAPTVSCLGLLVGLLLSLPAVATAAERTPSDTPLGDAGFRLLAVVDGLHIYERKDPTLLRLAFEAEIDAPVATLMLAVTDYPRQIGVMKHVGEVRVLECQNDELRVYQRLHLPVIDDRDYVLAVQAAQLGDVGVVSYRALKLESLSPKRGVVRILHHEGSWQFWPAPGGRMTTVRYQVALDFAGWVPRWLVRPGMIDELPVVFRNLQTMVSRTSKEQHPCLLKPLE